MAKTMLKRGAGILMPVSSLPSPYGIGTFGACAYEFADKLVKARQSYWQVLPLGPTSYGDSPYQSFSAFAGNPYFIDLDVLKEEGLLTRKRSSPVTGATGRTRSSMTQSAITGSRSLKKLSSGAASGRQRSTRRSARRTAAGWRTTPCTWR